MSQDKSGTHHCHPDCDEPATKHDIRELRELIMSTQADLVVAVNTLSTAADGLSISVDNIATAVERAIVILKNGTELTPDAEKALANLKTVTDNAVAARSKVDAEVANLDTVLPEPAPAAKVKAVA